MKAKNLNNKKSEQAMGLVSLSNDELKNVYGGAGTGIYFVQTRTQDNRIIWQIVVK